MHRSSHRDRLAVSLAFAVVGFLLSMWLVHIPAVQSSAGVGHGELGLTLLSLGLGSFVAMQLTGSLIARFGAKRPLLLGMLLMALALMAPALAVDIWTLGVALFVFGLGNGICEVAMNAEAVEVERELGRPIMSSFHALFSVGTALGAGFGGLLLVIGWGTLVDFALGAAVGIIVAFVSFSLLPNRAFGQTGSVEIQEVGGGSQVGRIVVLGALAFMLMLAEGVANDWSALHAVEHRGATEASAAAAYGTFAVTMTIGRLLVDRVAGRFGPVAVVRYGSLVAALGLVLVMTLPGLVGVLIGWAVFAIGLGGVVPQIFTAAGNLPVKRRAVMLARVVGAGYIGLLAGPAVIGWVADLTDLNVAMIVPVLLCLVGAVAARSVRAATPGHKVAQP